MVVPTVSPAVTAPVTTYHRNAQLAIDDLAKQLADSLRKLPGTESGEVPVDDKAAVTTGAPATVPF